jgi:tRNA 5-methylaminomethyl-2-thiouridine biosynthesis bifunctional protein
VRGQVSHLPATPQSQALHSVICSEGYVTPASKGKHCIGASFEADIDTLGLSEEEHRENLASLQLCVPTLYQALQAQTLDAKALDGRAAFRCTSPDYLPLVGPVAYPSEFNRRYRELMRDASLPLEETAPWVPGLYINSAHGSRGMVSAPLAGEILAAYLNDEPAPLGKHLLDAIHPNRFLLRELIRGKYDPNAT